MEFTSLDKRRRVISIFQQIEGAINQLTEWNRHVKTFSEYDIATEDTLNITSFKNFIAKLEGKGKSRNFVGEKNVLPILYISAISYTVSAIFV